MFRLFFVVTFGLFMASNFGTSQDKSAGQVTCLVSTTLRDGMFLLFASPVTQAFASYIQYISNCLRGHCIQGETRTAFICCKLCSHV